MRLWKLAGIAALAGAIAFGPSHAQQPQSISLIYDLHFGGFKVGHAKIDGDFGPEDYRATTRLQTTGVADAIFKATVNVESEGALNDSGDLVPKRFWADARTSRKDQMVEMVFRNGAPRIAEAKPAFIKKSYEIKPEKQVGVLDPLSAALHSLVPKPAEAVCDSRIEVFDGRKRFAIAVSNPRVKGDRIHCDGVYERIAGFKPKHMKRQKRFPFKVTFKVDGSGMALMERVLIETDFGFGTVKLRSAAQQG